MSSKSLLLKAFNKQFFDFLDDIIIIFPDKKEIKIALSYFTTIKTANPTILLKVWYSCVCVPYKEQIERGELQYFLEKDYSTDLSKMINGKEIMNFIDSSLRNPLRSMDAKNLEHCVKYIQLLTKISSAYHEKS
jgi:hypothetical protein